MSARLTEAKVFELASPWSARSSSRLSTDGDGVETGDNPQCNRSEHDGQDGENDDEDPISGPHGAVEGATAA